MAGKRNFTIQFECYKFSGKLYTLAEFELLCTNIGMSNHPPVCYMNDVVDHIQAIMAGDGSVRLPGLAGHTWDGYIRVDCDGYGFPVLIIPDSVRQFTKEQQAARDHVEIDINGLPQHQYGMRNSFLATKPALTALLRDSLVGNDLGLLRASVLELAKAMQERETS